MTTYLSLGSNVGDRMHYLREGVVLLSRHFGAVRTSLVYETEPVGYTEQAAFLNCVCVVETELLPHEILQRTQQIETELGRVRTFQNAPRTLDIDMLLHDTVVLNTANLTLPHPRMHERAFVLVPFSDVEPEVHHPVIKQSVRDLCSALGDYSETVQLWNEQL